MKHDSLNLTAPHTLREMAQAETEAGAMHAKQIATMIAEDACLDGQCAENAKNSGQPVTLTYQQKLDALSLRFYQGLSWTPKVGDYYTTSRADLELYQVVAIEAGKVHTRYCDPSGSTVVSEWEESEFTSAGFGPRRVYVPDFVLAIIRPATAQIGGAA